MCAIYSIIHVCVLYNIVYFLPALILLLKEVACHNHIRLYKKLSFTNSDNRLLVCGTGAYSVNCRTLSLVGVVTGMYSMWWEGGGGVRLGNILFHLTDLKFFAVYYDLFIINQLTWA